MSKVIDAEVKETELLEARDLIKLTQVPKVEYTQLKQFNAQIMAKIEDLEIDKIKPTEDNLRLLTLTRTELNKDFAEFENNRKLMEREVMKPLNDFKESYKEYIAEPFNSTVSSLTKKINTVTNDLVKIKTAEFKERFEKIKKEKNIKIIKFEDVNLNITRSASENKLKKEMDDFFEKVEGELKVIDSHPHAVRVLDEYTKSLDLASAITKVTQAVEREEKIKEQRAAQKAAEEKRKKEQAEREARIKEEQEKREAEIQRDLEAKKAYMEKVKKDAEAYAEVDLTYKEKPKQEVKKEPYSENLSTEVKPNEPEIMTVSFQITGTKEEIIAVRTFIRERGIKYE